MNQPKLKQKGRELAMPVSTDDQLKFYAYKIEELKVKKELEEAEQQELDADLLKRVAEMGYVVTAVEPSAQAASDEELNFQPWYLDVWDFLKQGLSFAKVSSTKGMWTMVFTVLILILGFAWYPAFFRLNDSEQRIHNAASSHFFSHSWMGMAVLLMGFGFQYLAFNYHLRYLWTNIDSEVSADQDFRHPTAEGKVRLLVALFTWAFPVFIITLMFQFILG
jgi:hypothetical protein